MHVIDAQLRLGLFGIVILVDLFPLVARCHGIFRYIAKVAFVHQLLYGCGISPAIGFVLIEAQEYDKLRPLAEQVKLLD